MLGECCGSSRQNPIVVTINDRVTKSEVQVPIGADALRRILVAGIGDGNDFPAFPALLLTIDRGDPSILSWFVEKRYNQITADINWMVFGLEARESVTTERPRRRGGRSETSEPMA